MKNYDYIFFDLDGTLTESGPGISRGVAAALETIGIKEDREEVLQSFVGPPLLQRFQEVYGVDPETGERLIAAYREYYSKQGVFENRVYDGIRETLQRLTDAGKKLAIASNKPGMYVNVVLEQYDLARYFVLVSAADASDNRMSKTDMLEYAISVLGITDRSKVLLVGDRKYDAVGARECGIDCLGVLYGYGSREELEENGVTAFAETASDIADRILGQAGA